MCEIMKLWLAPTGRHNEQFVNIILDIRSHDKCGLDIGKHFVRWLDIVYLIRDGSDGSDGGYGSDGSDGGDGGRFRIYTRLESTLYHPCVCIITILNCVYLIRQSLRDGFGILFGMT